MALGAAPAVPAVVGHQPVAQGLLGDRLQRRRQRGPDRQAALVEERLAVLLDQGPADLLGEIVRGHDLGRRPVAHHQRLGHGAPGVGAVDEAEIEHPPDHPVAARLGRLGLAARIVPGGRLGQAGQERRLGDGELIQRLVEVVERRRRHAVGAEAEIDLVQVQLEDLVLGERPLDPERQQRLLDLARQRDLAGQEEVLGDLLGDGRGPDRPAVLAEVPDVGQRGADDAEHVDPRMAVEILVLGGKECLDQALGDRLDRHEDPLLLRVLGHQAAVGGVDPGDGRRLIVGQLTIVGQIAAVAVEQVERPARADQRQHQQAGQARPENLQQLAQERSSSERQAPPAAWGRPEAPVTSARARNIRRSP